MTFNTIDTQLTNIKIFVKFVKNTVKAAVKSVKNVSVHKIITIDGRDGT